MLTNRLGLPSSIVAAVENDPYSRGDSDISVTQLIQPPYQRKLMQENESVQDVVNRIWALFGSSVHHILERAYAGQGIVEKRLYTKILGWTVSGQLDVLEDGVLSDWKVTSVWAKDGKIEWEQQLNLLRYLCYKNDLDVERLQVIAIYRDWMKSKSKEHDYPDAQVGVIEVPVWDMSEAQRFMYERVALHQSEDPEPCTDKERWATKAVYALKRVDRKTAIKLYGDQEEAQARAEELGTGHFVEFRPPEYKRCANYCDVAHVCPMMNEGFDAV